MLRHTKVVDLQNTIDEMQHEMNEVNAWSNLHQTVPRENFMIFNHGTGL